MLVCLILALQTVFIHFQYNGKVNIYCFVDFQQLRTETQQGMINVWLSDYNYYKVIYSMYNFAEINFVSYLLCRVTNSYVE